MQSKMSYFDWGIFKKTISRFWPIYTAYFAFWVLVMPLGFVNRSYITEIEFEIVQMIPQGSVLMGAAFSCISAIAVFAYLYNHRSCVMIHSLPVRREALFCTNYLAGLSFMIVPNILVALLTAVLVTANGWMRGDVILAIIIWLVCTCIICLFFYSFAVLLCMITGTWFMMPVIYGILNFTAILVESIVHAALEVLVYGYRAGATVMQVFSPIAHMMSEFRFYSWYSSERILGAAAGTYGYLAALTAVAGLFIVLALFVYKKRHMETAGEIISVPCLRPVFKYCFAAGCAVVIGAFIYGILGFDNGLIMYICAVIGGAIGYFAAVMAMKKSFKLKLSALKGFAVFAAVVTLLFAAVSFDIFGVESYTPNASRVDEATINVEGEHLSVTDGDISLAQLIQIHRKIIAQKEESISTASRIHTYGSGVEGRVVSIRIEYDLGQRTVCRYYRIPVTEDLFASPGSAQSLIADSVNSMEYLYNKFSWAYEDASPYQVNVDLYESKYKDNFEGVATEGYKADIDYGGSNLYLTITEPDTRIAALVNALRSDIQSGKYKIFVVDGDNAVGSVSFYYMIEDPDNYYLDLFGEKHVETRKESHYIRIYPGSELERLANEYFFGPDAKDKNGILAGN